MANKYPHELSGQSLDLNDIIVVQNGVSGMVGKNTVQELKDFIASSLGAGVAEVHVGATTPTTGEKLWLDTTANPAVLKLDPNQDGNWADAMSVSGGATNLTFTRNATTVTVISDTGNDVVLPAATTTEAGVMSAADKDVLTDLAPLADNVAELEALALSSPVDEVLTHSPAVNADVADNTAGDVVQDSNGVQYIVVNQGGTLTPLPLNDAGALLVSSNPSTLGITAGLASGQIVVDTSTSPDTSYVYNEAGEFLEIGATGSLPALPAATPASGTVTIPTVGSAPTTSTVGTVGKLTKNGSTCYEMMSISESLGSESLVNHTDITGISNPYSPFSISNNGVAYFNWGSDIVKATSTSSHVLVIAGSVNHVLSAEINGFIYFASGTFSQSVSKIDASTGATSFFVTNNYSQDFAGIGTDVYILTNSYQIKRFNSSGSVLATVGTIGTLEYRRVYSDGVNLYGFEYTTKKIHKLNTASLAIVEIIDNPFGNNAPTQLFKNEWKYATGKYITISGIDYYYYTGSPAGIYRKQVTNSYTWETLAACPSTSISSASISTSAPTANDDSGDGYVVGSTFIQTNAGGTAVLKVWRATSVGVGTATWVDVTTLNDTTYTAGVTYTVGDRKQLTITWNGTSWDTTWGNVT